MSYVFDENFVQQDTCAFVKRTIFTALQLSSHFILRILLDAYLKTFGCLNVFCYYSYKHVHAAYLGQLKL